MKTQSENTTAVQDQSRWQTFRTWISDVTEAIDYDPHANTDANIEFLRKEVERLSIRVNELEHIGIGE